MKTPWLAGFTVLVLTLSARASETHWTPLQLSIGPGEIALVDADTEVKGLRLGLFADNARVDGLDLCLAAGESRDGGSGLAFATFYANCGGDFLGRLAGRASFADCGAVFRYPACRQGRWADCRAAAEHEPDLSVLRPCVGGESADAVPVRVCRVWFQGTRRCGRRNQCSKGGTRPDGLWIEP